MGDFSVWHFTGLLVPVIWILPVILVAASSRGTGVERAVWALVGVMVSWIGSIGFRLSVRDPQ
jgi:hypothetical protein